MIRVNKNIARNQYNQGKIIRLIPAKLNFDTKVFQDVYLENMQLQILMN